MDKGSIDALISDAESMEGWLVGLLLAKTVGAVLHPGHDDILRKLYSICQRLGFWISLWRRKLDVSSCRIWIAEGLEMRQQQQSQSSLSDPYSMIVEPCRYCTVYSSCSCNGTGILYQVNTMILALSGKRLSHLGIWQSWLNTFLKTTCLIFIVCTNVALRLLGGIKNLFGEKGIVL